MTDISFWTIPADEMVHGGGQCTITICRPPFPASVDDLPPNDPVTARAVVEALPTVDAVLEELTPLPATEAIYLERRSDLELVRVGCWGSVIGIADPSFVDDGSSNPMLDETETLHQRYPDARIIGRTEVDCGETHTEDIIRLPGGTMFHASGWPGMEPWETTGDPWAVCAELGITPRMLDAAGLDLDAGPGNVHWAGLGALAAGPADPWVWSHLDTSVFRVRHTEDYTFAMEEGWFIGA